MARPETQKKLEGIRKKPAKKTTVYRMLKVGIELGLLNKEKDGIHSVISFDDFCAIPEIREWIEMLNPPNVKNIKQDKYSGTRGSHANKLIIFMSG